MAGTSQHGAINHELLNSVKETMKDLFKNVPTLLSDSSIYRVPERLRSVKHEAYTPMLVSIGPYHKDIEKLQPMEDHKILILKSLVGPDSTKLEDLVKVLMELELGARNCYSESICWESKEFIKMMLLDGCFIIELFRQPENPGLRNKSLPLFSNHWILNAVHRDLLLLENQLPFFVLEKLFTVVNNFSHSQRKASFLELTKSFLGSYGTIRDSLPNFAIHGGEHLVHLLLNNISYPYNKTCFDGTGTRELVFIPTATELHETGIVLKKSESQHLLDVTFKDGVLEIPPLLIDERSESLFRNLIAMEQCHCGKDDIYNDNCTTILSDYLTLMDCLVNTSADVALLRDRQIIQNWLGDNKEVAQLFNKFRIGVVPSSNGFGYHQLFKEVNAYYNTRWPAWKAKLERDYFNTPWAILSFIAAVLLLISTFIQTVCAILQVQQGRSSAHAP